MKITLPNNEIGLIGELRSLSEMSHQVGIALKVNNYNGKISIRLDPFAKMFKTELLFDTSSKDFQTRN